MKLPSRQENSSCVETFFKKYQNTRIWVSHLVVTVLSHRFRSWTIWRNGGESSMGGSAFRDCTVGWLFSLWMNMTQFVMMDDFIEQDVHQLKSHLNVTVGAVSLTSWVSTLVVIFRKVVWTRLAPGKASHPVLVKGSRTKILWPRKVIIWDATNVIRWEFTDKAVSLVESFNCPRSSSSLCISLNNDALRLLLRGVLV